MADPKHHQAAQQSYGIGKALPVTTYPAPPAGSFSRPPGYPTALNQYPPPRHHHPPANSYPAYPAPPAGSFSRPPGYPTARNQYPLPRYHHPPANSYPQQLVTIETDFSASVGYAGSSSQPPHYLPADHHYTPPPGNYYHYPEPPYPTQWDNPPPQGYETVVPPGLPDSNKFGPAYSNHADINRSAIYDNGDYGDYRRDYDGFHDIKTSAIYDNGDYDGFRDVGDDDY